MSCSLNVETPAVWVKTMLSAAIARIASSSGKRGLPGGGSRAGRRPVKAGGEYAWARLRRDAFGRRLLLVARGALAVRVVAALATNDHRVQGDAMTFHQ